MLTLQSYSHIYSILQGLKLSDSVPKVGCRCILFSPYGFLKILILFLPPPLPLPLPLFSLSPLPLLIPLFKY